MITAEGRHLIALPEDEIIHYQDKGEMPHRGRQAVRRKMQELGLPAVGDNEIVWIWMSRRGSFAKRYAAILDSEHVKYSQDQIAKIGTEFSYHFFGGQDYYFDFTQKLGEWAPGDFGEPDGHSCFWGARKQAIPLLKEASGFAMRFYDHDENGLGRMWLLPRIGGDYICFNGYHRHGMELSRMAGLFAQLVNRPCQRIHLTNYGTAGGLLWINGGIGYRIGEGREAEDLFIPEPGSLRCHRCGEWAHSEEYVYAGKIYCEDCYRCEFGRCEECGAVQPHGEMNGELCHACAKYAGL
jgi:hypothetical protein